MKVDHMNDFVSVEKLLEDFFSEVEKICEAHGISTEVVDDKETRT
jgi:hypothetical protein